MKPTIEQQYQNTKIIPPVQTFQEAQFPEPFQSGLEFNAPVRGPWNIVHMALLVPDAHLLYICARGCLRGVLMTAYEMHAENRMSWVGVAEDDLANGRLEEVTFASIQEIIDNLEPKPKLIFLYLSCIHKFSHFDYPSLIQNLEAEYPDIRFIDCHMMPTMRKSGPTDEERTRAKMYQCLTKRTIQDEKSITVLGNDRPLAKNSLLLHILKQAGYTIQDITSCTTYADFTEFSKSAYTLTFSPVARLAQKELADRCNQKALIFLPTYQLEQTGLHIKECTEELAIPYPEDLVQQTLETVDTELRRTRKQLGSRPIALDYTVTPRPLSLARLLLEYDFALACLFCDAFDPSEDVHFRWIREHFPHCTIVQTLSPKMRLESVRNTLSEMLQNTTQKDLSFLPKDILCLGQKAAFLSMSRFFVNHVYAGNMPDVSALFFLAEELRHAASTQKDLRYEIQLKGLGCPSCLTTTRFPKVAWSLL